jgi:uncharacterized repeat protein (TIGR03803 family)
MRTIGYMNKRKLITKGLRATVLGASAAATLLAQTTPWQLTTLTSFVSIGSESGAYPYSGVTIGKGGILYGTAPSTYTDGGNGVVYQLIPPASPGGAWTENVRYLFPGSDPAGIGPVGGLVIGSNGVLYGTTFKGGASGYGIVFSLTPTPGDYYWPLRVLYTFTGGADGAGPQSSLVMGEGGVLYGTTLYGGTGQCFVYSEPNGCGTVFSLTPPQSPGGDWTESVLYTFTGKADGAQPNGVAIAPNGVLYGTTQVDGIVSCLEGQGCGTVFRLAPSTGDDSWSLDTVYRFAGPPSDGGHPEAAVAIHAGVLYGSTGQGGQNGFGTVFSLTPPKPGGAWKESILYDFVNPIEGAIPHGLTFGKNGVIYGVNEAGGSLRNGTVFSLTPPSAEGGSWTVQVIYTFTGGDDGSTPLGTLAIGDTGVLYGTTESGGSGSDGTVFELTP